MSFHSKGTAAKKPRHSAKSGQTIVEYALTVTIMTMIFGIVFYNIRISIFKLWVCEIGPRIEAPRGCANISKCWDEIQYAGGDPKPQECSR